MTALIEEARIELAKWEKRVADDVAALKAAEECVEHMRQQLAASTKATTSLRYAVQQWDAMHSRCEPSNAALTRRP